MGVDQFWSGIIDQNTAQQFANYSALSIQEGIPYQTLAASILHKYVIVPQPIMSVKHATYSVEKSTIAPHIAV